MKKFSHACLWRAPFCLFLLAFVLPVFSTGKGGSVNGSQPLADQASLPIYSEGAYIALPGDLIDQGFHRLDLTVSQGPAVIYEEQLIVYSTKDNEYVLAEIMAASPQMLASLRENATAIGQALAFDLLVDGNFYRSYSVSEILGETGQINKGISDNLVGQNILYSAFHPLPQELRGNQLLSVLAGSCPCVPPDPSYCDTQATCLEECDMNPGSQCYKQCMNRAAACRRGYTVASTIQEEVELPGSEICTLQCMGGMKGWECIYLVVVKKYEIRICTTTGTSCKTLVSTSAPITKMRTKPYYVNGHPVPC